MCSPPDLFFRREKCQPPALKSPELVHFNRVYHCTWCSGSNRKSALEDSANGNEMQIWVMKYRTAVNR